MLHNCITVTPELIRAAQRGNLRAFNCLASECQDTIYNLVCWLSPMDRDNEGIVQGVLQRLYRDLHAYRNGDFHLWLLKTLIKACRPHMNRHNFQGAVDRSLQGYLAELPPDLRLVIVMVDVEGLDYTQAAAVLGIPRRTIRSRLAKARQCISEACVQGVEQEYA